MVQFIPLDYLVDVTKIEVTSRAFINLYELCLLGIRCSTSPHLVISIRSHLCVTCGNVRS